MSRNLYDIAIIGGGLAGLALSIQSANAGYKTLLFEKEKYPFHKVCGEYISMESFAFLESLGLPLSSMNLPVIHTLHISDANGKLYEFKLPLGGFGISRFMLDDALSKIARQAGVELQESLKVADLFFVDEVFSIQAGNALFHAKVAAGSFGKRSNLDIKWKRDFTQNKADKLNNYIGVKYHIRYPFPKDTIALHNFYNGYCGISNIEDDKCCLCYLTTAENLQSNNNSIRQMQENILFKNPQLKKIFLEAKFLYDEPLAISQVSFSKKTQVENHLLMIGDAAGMITPLCGNGMSMALHASKIAFRNMHAFLQHTATREKMEQQYSSQWQQQFAKRLMMGRTVQRFFGSNKSTSLFLKTMHYFPLLANTVIRATHGKPF